MDSGAFFRIVPLPPGGRREVHSGNDIGAYAAGGDELQNVIHLRKVKGVFRNVEMRRKLPGTGQSIQTLICGISAEEDDPVADGFEFRKLTTVRVIGHAIHGVQYLAVDADISILWNPFSGISGCSCTLFPPCSSFSPIVVIVAIDSFLCYTF